MGELTDRFRELSTRLVRRFGEDGEATIRRRVYTHNPSTGEETEGTPLEGTIWCVVSRNAAEGAPEGIREGVISITVPAEGLAFTPEPGDEVEVTGDGATYIVQPGVRTARPAGIEINHRFTAARIGT